MCASEHSLFDCQRPLSRLLGASKDAQNSTLNFAVAVLSAQLRAARIITNRFARVGVSCPRPVFGCTADRKNFWMEARGFEPLTSGLQSPRSAKLSYAPKRERLVAGAGFEPATFGL